MRGFNSRKSNCIVYYITMLNTYYINYINALQKFHLLNKPYNNLKLEGENYCRGLLIRLCVSENNF